MIDLVMDAAIVFFVIMLIWWLAVAIIQGRWH